MRLFRYGMLGLPLALLVMSMGAANAQAFWEYGNIGYYHRGGLGYGYTSWYWQARRDRYYQGFSDGNKIAYNCSGHASVHCSSYGHGYANGQTQYNNQYSWQPSQNQEQQQQNSYSSATVNPNVKVIINNLPSELQFYSRSHCTHKFWSK